MAAPVVALVLVSHSRLLADGVAEVAAQMAPDVVLVPAGGTEDGRVGTGVDVVTAALERALADGRSAVVLTDLGSAALTTETVLELLEPEVTGRVRLADAPFVEGAVEAAVVAQGGADLDRVHHAAERAGASFARSGGPAGPTAAPRPTDASVGAPRIAGDARSPEVPPPGRAVADRHESATGPAARGAGHPGAPTARGTAVLRNRLGLHARPAAQLARTAGAFDAVITVNGADARSVLALVGLNAVGGQEVVVAASGPQARTAVTAVVDELENGFGEA